MKKLISTVMFLIFALMPLCFASELPVLIDNAGYLSDDQAEQLEQMLDEVLTDDFCAVVFTEDEPSDDDPQAAADDFFDYEGYLEQYSNGIVFYICKSTRQYAFSTTGTAIDTFNDSNLDVIETDMLDFLLNDEYFEAFCSFAGNVKYYLNAYTDPDYSSDYINDGSGDYNGGYDYDYYDDEPLVIDIPTIITFVAISALIALIIAAIATAIRAGRMNTAKLKTDAGTYVDENGLNVTASNDIYLYCTVTRTARPQNEDHHTSGGGGSSTHVSSSGTTHGGRNGSF